MPSTLGDRRKASRQRKLAGLEQEFASWQDDSRDGGLLHLHYSQIRRIVGVLDPLRQAMEARPANAATWTDRDIERTSLELHRVWEFFRSKFAMRKIEWLRGYLDAVDDFAWACYKPARDAAAAAARIGAGELKEPPLVFFGGGWSPFAMPRNYPFEAERVPNERVRTAAFVEALKRLPVPVIGIPWFQVRHLPDAVVIGHEVGHLVEDDLGLTAEIQAAVRGAVAPERQGAWLAWAGEVFGDFYGQLATGPAFVSGLAEVLGDDPQFIASEARTGGQWTDYPPTYLRLRLNLAMLDALGFAEDATRLGTEWTETYGSVHGMPAFDQDLPSVARALKALAPAALGGKPLADVLSFRAVRDQARVAARRLAQGAAPDPGDVRALVAAARLRFDEDPAAYTEGVQTRVLATIIASLPPGVRGDVRKAHVDADEATAHSVLELFANARG